ncbi:MAG: SPOR domain-containing protein [Deltaproteobacteria bacterium]|jgi:hypothetical protein|nr:SPOR domain-containing protein [Deltaproteobacteria bacterium]
MADDRFSKFDGPAFENLPGADGRLSPEEDRLLPDDSELEELDLADVKAGVFGPYSDDDPSSADPATSLDDEDEPELPGSRGGGGPLLKVLVGVLTLALVACVGYWLVGGPSQEPPPAPPRPALVQTAAAPEAAAPVAAAVEPTNESAAEPTTPAESATTVEPTALGEEPAAASDLVSSEAPDAGWTFSPSGTPQAAAPGDSSDSRPESSGSTDADGSFTPAAPEAPEAAAGSSEDSTEAHVGTQAEPASEPHDAGSGDASAPEGGWPVGLALVDAETLAAEERLTTSPEATTEAVEAVETPVQLEAQRQAEPERPTEALPPAALQTEPSVSHGVASPAAKDQPEAQSSISSETTPSTARPEVQSPTASAAAPPAAAGQQAPRQAAAETPSPRPPDAPAAAARPAAPRSDAPAPVGPAFDGQAAGVWAANLHSSPNMTESEAVWRRLADKTSANRLYSYDATVNGQVHRRIRLGFFKSKAEAEAAALKLSEAAGLGKPWLLQPGEDEVARYGAAESGQAALSRLWAVNISSTPSLEESESIWSSLNRPEAIEVLKKLEERRAPGLSSLSLYRSEILVDGKRQHRIRLGFFERGPDAESAGQALASAAGLAESRIGRPWAVRPAVDEEKNFSKNFN